VVVIFSSGGFGMLQVITGYVACQRILFASHSSSPRRCLSRYTVSTAQYTAETFWHYCVVLGIHDVASAIQAMILGRFCIALELAKNLLFVQVVKWILFAVLGILRYLAFVTATAFVLRKVCGSFFLSLLEAQDQR
jgi:hypothetical protein